MNRFMLKICCALIGLAVIFSAPAMAQSWKIFGWSMGGDCSLLYDEEHCILQGGDIVRIPVLKMGWSSDCREKELASLGAMGLPAAALQEWSQTLQVYEINLKTKNYRIVSTAAYDRKGTELGAYRTASAWYCIVPGSATDNLFKALTATPEPKEVREVVVKEVPVPEQEEPGPRQKPIPPSVPQPLYPSVPYR